MPSLSCYFLLLVAALPSSGKEEARMNQAEVQQWINKLDSDTYWVRERAMRRLTKAGPAILDQLAAAADGDNLEISMRAVRLLLKISSTDDQAVSLAAWEHLARLKNNRVEREKAATVLGQLRSERALAEILRLGGEEKVNFPGYGPPEMLHLQLGAAWSGGDDALALLKEIPALTQLSIHGTPITDSALRYLAELNHLKRLELFGTEVTMGGIQQLRGILSDVEIDFRRGALLGINGTSHPQGTQITMVQAGTAADDAGIFPGDIIVSFNRFPTRSFEELTALIGGCRPGDRAVLQINRNGQLLYKTVIFGGWK